MPRYDVEITVQMTITVDAPNPSSAQKSVEDFAEQALHIDAQFVHGYNTIPSPTGTIIPADYDPSLIGRSSVMPSS